MPVSVIIPTKNAGPLFGRVLTSVLSQKADFSYDVLVIDSGSTDGTVELVRSVGDPRLRLHTIAPEDFGHGRTRNAGIAMTEGEFCALITQDAEPADASWLANLAAPALADASVAGVFGRHLAYPDASPFVARELDDFFADHAKRPRAALSADRPDVADRSLRHLHFFSDNNALVRRAAWRQVPYPDVAFAEDQLWARRVMEAGWAKVYAHDAAVYHSHTYTLRGRFVRSYEEAHALHDIFGTRRCPTLGHLLYGTATLTWRDLRHALRESLWRSHPREVMRAPVDNFMRQAGRWMGERGAPLPRWLCDAPQRMAAPPAPAPSRTGTT